MNTQDTIAVIMAGGRGTRLWPMSRIAKPKQFHALASERTLIQETFDRLEPIFGVEKIYVATNIVYVDDVHKELPAIDIKNIIAEPVARDTASGMALVCAVIAARHPDALIATFPADHVITNPAVLQNAIAPAVDYITDDHRDHIVTFGIRPRYPEIGFGYIKRGAVSYTRGEHTIFDVAAFVEKPDIEHAKQYLAEGQYEWNAGMFIFHVQAMLEKFAQHLPDTYAKAIQIKETVDQDTYETTLEAVFPTMEKVSIDYAILEKDQKVAVLPLTLSWSDVGSWAALRDMIASHTKENVVRGELIAHDSEGLLVRASKPVIAIGVEDLVIVETDDVLLVCDRDHTQEISHIVKRLEADGRKELL